VNFSSGLLEFSNAPSTLTAVQQSCGRAVHGRALTSRPWPRLPDAPHAPEQNLSRQVGLSSGNAAASTECSATGCSALPQQCPCCVAFFCVCRRLCTRAACCFLHLPSIPLHSRAVPLLRSPWL
jgi:hypothetical protein